MNSHFVIAINRMYGSGGKRIGTALADRLGVPLIDREIERLASEQSGISEELFSLANKRLKLREQLLALVSPANRAADPLLPREKEFTSDVNLFKIQSQMLADLASKTSFIVVGKSANIVLASFDFMLSVCVMAEEKDCVTEISERLLISREAAERQVRSTNRYREQYNKVYAGQNWMDPSNYDLVLNTSKLPRDKCADIIIAALEAKLTTVNS